MTQVGPIPVLPDIIEGNARVKVLNNGTLVGTRRTINVVQGSNVTLTFADDPANERVTITVASSGTSGAAGGDLTGTYPNPTIGSGKVTSTAIADGTIQQADLTSGYRMTFAGTSAPGSPSEGDQWFDTTNNLLNVYNGSVWYTTTPVSATVVTNESRTSSTFGVLATAGPAVSVLTGTRALVTVGAYLSPAIGDNAVMGFAVSNATTLAADIDRAVFHGVPSGPSTGSAAGQSKTVYLTGLNAGTNTFTSQYCSSGGSLAFFEARVITVIGLP